MKHLLFVGIILLSLNIASCGKNTTNTQQIANNATAAQTNTQIDKPIPQLQYEIIDTFAHPTENYTQGLVIYENKLYEGTGLEGYSHLFRYSLNKMKEEKSNSIGQYFGEGVAVLGNKIYQLTWLNQRCLVYDLATFKIIDTLIYSGEGWGLTSDDSLLYMSDGSATIRVIDPNDFTIKRNIRITRNGTPVRMLNELELVDSLLYANVYMQDLIIVANIRTGAVVAELNISNLRKMLENNPEAEVSNGIAYDKKNKKFYLTGKNWNKLFVVEIRS
jgi:glutamine cyclotransferase